MFRSKLKVAEKKRLNILLLVVTNIALTSGLMKSNKFYYIQTAKVVNSKDVSCYKGSSFVYGVRGVGVYGNSHFLKKDFTISINISSVFGISKHSQCWESVSFTNRNLGFDEKLDNISVCPTEYITVFYKTKSHFTPQKE